MTSYSQLMANFIVALLTVLSVIYMFKSLNFVISIMSSVLISLTITWQLTKYVNRFIGTKISSNNKAILITGCDTGFGNHLALKLNSKGFIVYATVLDNQSDSSKKLVNDCVFPELMTVLKMDVRSDESVIKVYDYVRNDLETDGFELWGLVNNAAILNIAPIDWGNIETVENIFDVNVFGLVRVTRIFLPLIRQSKGRIVNVSSGAGKLTIPFSGIYSMSKHAVNSFSDALRREMQKFGIKVSFVMPYSPFNTNMTNKTTLHRAADNLWNNTNDCVKQYYGQQYIDDLMKVYTDYVNNNMCDNLDLVIDSIIDALVSNSPKTSYTIVADWLNYVIIAFIDYLPIELLDKLLLYPFRNI